MITELERLAFRQRTRAQYGPLWEQMMGRLEEEGGDLVLLQGCANYLFRTGSVRWGMDVSFREPAVFEGLRHRLPDDLRALSFILVTHGHIDHFDPDQAAYLCRTTPVRWIVPDFLHAEFLSGAGLPENRVQIIGAGQTIRLEDISITAFGGLHGASVPALGYCVDTGARRLLFPGDVREYEPDRIPRFDGVDCLFSHVWLGRANAQNPPWEPYLSQFCRFAAAMGPRRLFLCHLYDTPRPLSDLWTFSHCGYILDRLMGMAPEIQVEVPRIGRAYML